MNLKLKLDPKTYLIFIPAITAFLIALIPTLTYNFPLSSDIFYHVNIAHVYCEYGFTLTNPLNLGYGDAYIGYLPLFHLILGTLGNALNIDYLQLARFLQPFLLGSLILSLTYVTYKFYGLIAGVAVGFIILSSQLLERLILPLPENLALIFLIWGLYTFYKSFNDSKHIYAIATGLLLILTAITHQLAALSFFIIISSTLINGLICKDVKIFKSYIIFLAVLGVFSIIAITLINHLMPELISEILMEGIHSATGLTTLGGVRPLGILNYAFHIGPLVGFFAAIGTYYALKRREQKDLLVLIWIIFMFIFSVSYLFGLYTVDSYRILVYILIPSSILAGLGIKSIYHKINDSKIEFKNAGAILIYFIIGISILYGICIVSSPRIAYFGVETEFGEIQIAPPTESEVDIAN